MTPDEFNAAFDTFRVSAFRLETLQGYAIDTEDVWLRAFREGLPRPERSVRTSPWLQRIATTTMAGKSWSRVRLIRHPPTEYVQYELLSYVESAAVGEEIRIVDLNEHPALAEALGPDFWLFDSGQLGGFAVVIHYDTQGAVRGYERIDDSAFEFSRQRLALDHSISLAEYLASRR